MKIPAAHGRNSCLKVSKLRIIIDKVKMAIFKKEKKTKTEKPAGPNAVSGFE